MPAGRLNLAVAPVPSVDPREPAAPASVVTSPVAITTLRIVWLAVSATRGVAYPRTKGQTVDCARAMGARPRRSLYPGCGGLSKARPEGASRARAREIAARGLC